MVRAPVDSMLLPSEHPPVEAAMLNSATPKDEIRQTYNRLMNPPANGEEGIKLLYVTVGPGVPLRKTSVHPVPQPERIKQSATFMRFLLSLAMNGLLGASTLHIITTANHTLVSPYCHRRSPLYLFNGSRL
jgi:hypothetical protein